MNPRRHAAIEEAHPDGIVEPHMQPEDSWLFDMWDDLFARLGRIRGAELTHKRPFLETALDPDMDPEESGGEVYDDLSASYRELFLGFTAADCHYEHDVEIGECDGRQRCLRARGVIGCITAVSLVAPFALVEPDYLEHLEDGTTCVPSIERGVYDEDGRPMDRWEVCHSVSSKSGLRQVRALRERVVAALEDLGIVRLPEEVARQTVEGLAPGDGVLIGEQLSCRPISVRDARFFLSM